MLSTYGQEELGILIMHLIHVPDQEEWPNKGRNKPNLASPLQIVLGWFVMNNDHTSVYFVLVDWGEGIIIDECTSHSSNI